MPYAFSYLAHKVVDEFRAAWHVVNADYYYLLAAGWVHTLMTDKVFAWLDATALRRMAKLDLHHMASGPGGQAMLDMFHKMHKATEVFPWTIFVKDVIRRDTQTRVAGQVHVNLDSTSEYGFTLNYPCRGFASRSAWGGGTDDEGESPAAAAQGNGGFVRHRTRSAGGPSRRAASPSRRGSLSPVRETRVACGGSRHHLFGSSSRRSDLLTSSVRRRNCPGNRPTAQPSPNGRRGSRQSPGGNRIPKHSCFYQTAMGTTSPLSINPSPTRAPAAKVATPHAPNR